MSLVGHILSSVGQDNARPWLSALVGPQLEALRLAVAEELSPTTKPVVLQQLRMLAALICGLATEEAPEGEEGAAASWVSLVELVFGEAGAIVTELAEKYCCDDQVVEVRGPVVTRLDRCVWNESSAGAFSAPSRPYVKSGVPK